MVRRSPREEVQSTWLSMLREELAMISMEELSEPEFPIEEGETSLGLAAMESRKLWTLFTRIEEKSTRMLVDAKYVKGGASAKEEVLKKSYELKVKSDLIHNILFMNLKDQFGIWDPAKNVGLRQGFIVVSIQAETEPRIPHFLRDLFGGGK